MVYLITKITVLKRFVPMVTRLLLMNRLFLLMSYSLLEIAVLFMTTRGRCYDSKTKHFY